MPEIPEIETVKNHLIQKIQGKTVQSVLVNRHKAINVTKEALVQALAGQAVASVRRRAKQLIISFTNEKSLIIHFMLEGYTRFFYSEEPVDGQPSVLFELATNESLAFYKMNLGYIHLVDTTQFDEMPDLADLGPEPLDPDFSATAFLTLLGQRKGMIKPLLMDQQFIAGIGNVYSNEILFCCRLLPTRKVGTIADAERQRLYHCMQTLLKQAIAAGGVYDEPFCSDDHLTGGYENSLQVAYRTGQPCYTCGTAIITSRVGGRNAFYCPHCQH